MRHKTSNYTFSHDYGNINQGPIASYSRTGNTLDHGRIILIMVFVEKCVPRSRMRRLLFERTAPRRSALKNTRHASVQLPPSWYAEHARWLVTEYINKGPVELCQAVALKTEKLDMLCSDHAEVRSCYRGQPVGGEIDCLI